MHPSTHQFREAIASGRPVIGVFLVEFSSPAVVNVLADAKFDFLMIDCEHGNYDPREVEAMIDTAWQAGVCMIVRTPNEGRDLITRSLDAGAGGILVPAIDSMDQVHRVVRATKYRPLGKRGVHLFRGHTRHQRIDWQSFMEEANRDVLTLIQIELAGALEIVEEIAATEGVDGLYIGPGDLSVDLGVPGQWDSPLLVDAIRKTVDACRRHNKIIGCHFNDFAVIPRLREMGVQMFGHSCDIALFAQAAKQVTTQFSTLLGHGT